MTSQRAWELRLDPPASGQVNMDTDARLLGEAERASGPRTIVRFYAWTSPTLSLGRNQVPERAADLEFCRQHRIDVVRRPTGGRAVLHGHEVTYAVVSNEPDQFGGRSVYGTYRRVSEALAEGYRRLGVGVSLAAGTRPGGSGHPPVQESPCFVSQSRYELTVGGRKIVGSAQRRLRRAFLQHGSMPITLDRELLAGATRFAEAGVLDREMTSLSECLGVVPDPIPLVRVFIGVFEEFFGVALDPTTRGKPV